MKAKYFLIFALMCAVAQGAWATDYSVKNDSELREAIANNNANITVTADIDLSNSTLSIAKNTTVTINLNGHTLDRKLTQRGEGGGQVITVREKATLNLSNGTLKGGWGGNGGGIANEGGTANLTNVSITGCVADDRGGGIANGAGGTLTLDGCTITGNTSNDKTAPKGGGGIYNAGTLKMKGTNIVNDNWKPGGMRSNLYLKNGTVVTVTGALTDSHIGVDMETLGTFTSGYSTYHRELHPAGIFTADKGSIRSMKLENNEGKLSNAIPEGGVYYVERSWNATAERVEANYRVRESQYTTLTGGSADTYLDPGWYVVKGSDVEYSNIIYMNGNGEYHLILCDGASLKAWFFTANSPSVIHIYGQGDDTGKMTNTYETFFTVHQYRAGLGGEYGEANGTIVIHGGDINVHGGFAAPGIGNRSKDKQGGPITIYGGTVKAYGFVTPDGSGGGAGIGGGWNSDGGTITIYGGSVYATANGYTAGGAGIGSGSWAKNGGTINIYGGYVEATGDEGGAGIGSGYGTNGAEVTIHGGTVKAYGKAGGPGIGAGVTKNTPITTGTLTVTGGKVYAYGGVRGAGIGGGWDTNGTNVTVSGGYVYAEGGQWAAGIGCGSEYSSSGSHGGTLTVTGGYVEAHGGEDGAGIGGGEDGDGGTVNISGGEVRAYGNTNSAGIGGGEDGNGGNVTITGGIVIAQSGGDQRAIGAGYGSDSHGSLTFADNMGVFVTTQLYRSVWENRVKDCRNFKYVRVNECAHGVVTYTINDGGTHTAHCKFCTKAFTPEAHTVKDGVCTVCGASSTNYTVSVYLPNGSNYGSAITYTMATGEVFNLPAAPETSTPDFMEFAGWLVADPIGLSSFVTDGNEELLAADASYTISSNVSFTARYRYIDISLADDASNDDILYRYDGRKAHSVTLTGRTLYKDGDWNTLCLPFNASLTGDLAGATLMELDVEGTYDTDKKTGFDDSDGTLYLFFKDASSIVAGKPYIIKWTATEPDYIENPVFSNVTISDNVTEVVSTDGYFAFVGTFSPHVYTETNKSILFLGSGNSLYYPLSGARVNACRAYFQLNGIEVDDPENGVRSFVLNFEEGETTGIVPTTDRTDFTDKADAWYTVNGVKLSGKPSQKGVYIHGGRKVVIK